MFKHQKTNYCSNTKIVKFIYKKELFVARHHFHQLLGRKETFALNFFSYQQKKKKKKKKEGNI